MSEKEKCPICNSEFGIFVWKADQKVGQIDGICNSCLQKVLSKCESQHRSSFGKSSFNESLELMETLTEWQVKEIVKNYSWITNTKPIPEDSYVNAIQGISEKEDIKSGTLEELPSVTAQNIVMTKNEVCYFQENASLCITKNIVTGSIGGYGGVNIRVAKGMSVHSGATNRKTIREDVVENILGSLCITNKRVVFLSQQQGFSKQLAKLTGIIPYSDGISMQFDSNTFTILTRQPVLIAEILSIALADIEL